MSERDIYNPQPAERDDVPTTGRDEPRQDESDRRAARPRNEDAADYLALLERLSATSSDGDHEDDASARTAVSLNDFLSSFDDGEDT